MLSFGEKLDRIRRLGENDVYDPLGRSFMHAYIGCLSPRELCDAVDATLPDPIAIHRGVRVRLFRVSQSEALAEMDGLLPRLLDRAEEQIFRPRVEACLSHLYLGFSAPDRARILERWLDKSTASSRARWLKAIDSDVLHYSDAMLIDFWNATGDARAAKIIVQRVDPSAVAPLLLNLISRGVEGWIVAKGFLRAGALSETEWSALREAHPATYAYLCAKGIRKLNTDDAIRLVQDAPDSYDGGKALAVWALGQLGLEAALDELWRQRTVEPQPS